ncbi:phosphatidate cytidylyltransferase [Acholeplasma laidlawii]|uniref:phosphatidate cytidylyltransferase n=1 Tax=Acholeplasma laidlawii TaxID=2148 RepID=UPI0018C23B27|nr:phosphatidate cytidylyltransferase [Acholeplasma laidlawii]MBG0763006.1 phosphatidate cytidylyltransferase [Acholeplasma laidlawii]
MKKRIITAIVLILLLLPITVLNYPNWVFSIFQMVMLLFVIMGALELIHMYEKEKPIKIVVQVVIIVLSLLTYMNVGGMIAPLNPQVLPGLFLITLNLNPVIILSFVTVILLSLLVFIDDFSGSDLGKAITIINYIGLGAASITILRYLGVRFIVYVALISMMTDIFAYFFGIAFGKHKMAPRISPKKSWEGAIAGTLFGTIIASSFAIFYGVIFSPEGFLGYIFNPDGYQTIFDNFTSIGNEPLFTQALIIIPITLLGSISAQIGDLVASKLKRNYKIKDFGNIFPGHGGILDRFDSIIFIGIMFLGIFILIKQFYPM